MKMMKRMAALASALSMGLLCLPMDGVPALQQSFSEVMTADAATKYGGDFNLSIDRVKIGFSEVHNVPRLFLAES